MAEEKKDEGSIVPDLVELMKQMILAQGHTNERLSGLAVLVQGTNARLDGLTTQVQGLAALMQGTNARLDAQEDLRARVVKLEQAVFKDAAE